MNLENKISQIVLQPTSFCNLDCKYCYLPDRQYKHKMPLNNIDKLFKELTTFNYLNDKVEIRWHAGEPLAVPIDFYRQAIEIINYYTNNHSEISFSLQTNATPINDEWCELFISNKFELGVSLDGPKYIHDENRVMRNGKGTYLEVMEKINMLKKRNIKFHTISVLTNFSLDFANEIFDFFCELDAESVGFNVEETEGINKSKSFAASNFIERYYTFMKRLFKLNEGGKLKIREFDQIYNWIKYGEGDRPNFMVEAFRILSMDWKGDISSFSPELLSYPQYAFSNIHLGGIQSIPQNQDFKTIAYEIKQGVEQCKSICPYFKVCGGGAPSNKLWENNAFNTTSTLYCTSRFKVITDILLEYFEMHSKNLNNK